MVTKDYGGADGMDDALIRWLAILAIVLAFLILATKNGWAQTAAQDAIDLHQVVMHGPINPADLPVSGPITRVEVRRAGPYRGDGFVFYSPAAEAWPDVHAMGLGDGGGLIQFTVWACVRVGEIHCGGFVQNWRGARGTGAPWLQTVPDGRSNYQANWAYDSGRWGPMASYQPRPGDTVWVFLVAGNARAGQEYERTIQARTNVVAITYPAGDQGDFDFAAVSPPTPALPPPTTQPATPPPVSTTYDAATLDWIRRLYDWSLQNAVTDAERDRLLQTAIQQIYAQNERIYADLTAQHQHSQQFAAGGTDWSGVFLFVAKYVLPAIAAAGAGVAVAK